MMKNNYDGLILSIADPCKEHWQDMVDNDLGKHCSVCNKEVLDFTHLTDAELLNILEKTSGRICGRFRSMQLNRLLIKQPHFKSANPKYHKMLAALLSLSTTIGGLQASDVNSAQVNHIVQIPSNDSIPESKVDTINQNSEEYIFRGKVEDKTYSESVMGASISINTGKDPINAVTDLDGNFEISIPKEYVRGNSIDVYIDLIGYEKKSLNIPLNRLSKLQIIYLNPSSSIFIGEVIKIKVYDDPIYRRRKRR